MKKLAFLIIALIFIQSSAFASRSPELAIKTFDGENFDLKEKHGKVILVNFWASWCLDCRKEMVILDELYQECHEKGLEIIGISIDSKKDREVALNLARNLPYKNAILHDLKKSSFDNVEFVPTNYAIDKSGNLASTIDGDNKLLTKKDFLDILLPLLKQPAK